MAANLTPIKYFCDGSPDAVYASMPKRKFEDDNAADGKPNVSNGALRMQRERLEAILELAKKTLSRALKVAKGFERQKLGRRQKVAKEQKDDAGTVRLKAEEAALKAFDLTSLAELQLYKNLSKTKRIASAPAFPQYIRAKVQASLQPQDAAHANVQARMFNSKPVKTAMNDIINKVRAVLAIEDTQLLRNKRIRAADYCSDQSAGKEQSWGKPKNIGSQSENDQEGSDWHGCSTAESVQDDDHNTDSDDEIADYGMYDSRLAASSDEETDIEEPQQAVPEQDGKVGLKEPGRGSPTGTKKLRYILSEDLSLSPEPENLSPSPSPPSLTQKAPARSFSKPKVTTFIPSLAVGGYWSGSDSTASDLDTGDTKTRKNRRGQQERRAIWEKKYGRNANHLKKQSQVQNRDEGWDLRRGARSSDDTRGKRGRGRGRGGTHRKSRAGEGGSLGATGANSDPVLAKKVKAVEQPLHPSWVAAKKRKDENRAVAFAGKKVVFDKT